MNAAIIEANTPGGHMSQLPGIISVMSQQDKVVNRDEGGAVGLQNLTKLMENNDGFQLMSYQFEPEYATDKWSNAKGSETSGNKEPEEEIDLVAGRDMRKMRTERLRLVHLC